MYRYLFCGWKAVTLDFLPVDESAMASDLAQTKPSVPRQWKDYQTMIIATSLFWRQRPVVPDAEGLVHQPVLFCCYPPIV